MLYFFIICVIFRMVIVMSKEKKKIFIYMVSVFVIVSVIVFLLIISNKTFVFNYDVSDISFEYYSNFKVKKKDENNILISSKDNIAKISVSVETKDNSYAISDYEVVSNDIMSKLVDEKYEIIDNECLDHMCTRTYSFEKNKKQVVVEFRENILITYLFECNDKSYDNYVKGFKLIVNSFVKNNNKVE